MLDLSTFSHNHHPSRVKMVAKFIRRGIRVQNIEDIAVKNGDFRQVLYTAKNCQLVVMAAKPEEEIGTEYQAWRSQTPSMKAR